MTAHRTDDPRSPVEIEMAPANGTAEDMADTASRPGGWEHGPTRADRTLTGSAWRRLALLATAAVTAAVLLVGGVAWLVVAREQARAVDGQLAAALVRIDDVTDPPASIVLFVRDRRGATVGTPGSPAGLPDRAALDRVAATGQPLLTEVSATGRTFRVRTERRADRIVQAAYDLSGGDAERDRLLSALAVAEALGVGAAVGLGAVLGRRAVRPLGEALDRQRRFVADAAHELRTPLTLLHTRVQLMERTARRRGDLELAGEAGEVVDDTRRLADVIDDLLLSADLAHDAGRHACIDLDRLARDVVGSAAAHAEELGVLLTLSTSGSSAGARVVGVEPALRRALAALVDNALGHTPKGGAVAVSVRAADGHDTGMVAIGVADTGLGLDPSDAERLFTRFARGEWTGGRRRYGLGLALVHETVANHHGRIRVDGAPGHGASFTLLLPRTS